MTKGTEADWKERLRPLAPAQVVVLRQLGQGKMTKEIASYMHISEDGVKYHRRMIYYKLGIKSLAEAIRIAIESGLTTDGRN